MSKILFVGDQHVQVTNLDEIEKLICFIENIIDMHSPDIIILGGDMLHTHERLHTTALNKACEFIERMRNKRPTYVLVGNHDYEGNQQFLTTRHWLNPLKEWTNVTIIDTVTVILDNKMILVPYVPPGRFIEALETHTELKNGNWKQAKCIFAHQEFYMCQMGAIKSEIGDKWDENYPFVISGHIHGRQLLQKNIFYSGSSMQHAFGESDKNILAIFHTDNLEKYYNDEITFPEFINEIEVNLPRKKILYIDVNEIDDFNIEEKALNSDDKFKLTVSGNVEEFKALKKTKRYKQIVDSGVKVVFKPKNIINKENIQGNKTSDNENISNIQSEFMSVLQHLIESSNNQYLTESYKEIMLDSVHFLI